MATKEEKFEHTCQELLTFDEDDIKAVKKYGWRTLNKIGNTADLEAFKFMPQDSNYYSLVGLFQYMRVHDKSPDDIYQMTSDEYDALDHK